MQAPKRHKRNPGLTERRFDAQMRMVNCARYYPEQLEEARAQFSALRIAELVERELKKAPPLRQEQLDIIAQVLSAAILNPA